MTGSHTNPSCTQYCSEDKRDNGDSGRFWDCTKCEPGKPRCSKDGCDRTFGGSLSSEVDPQTGVCRMTVRRPCWLAALTGAMCTYFGRCSLAGSARSSHPPRLQTCKALAYCTRCSGKPLKCDKCWTNNEKYKANPQGQVRACALINATPSGVRWQLALLDQQSSASLAGQRAPGAPP